MIIPRGEKCKFNGEFSIVSPRWFIDEGHQDKLIKDTHVISRVCNTLLQPLSIAVSLLLVKKGRYGGICLINLSNKSDSCSRAYVDEWPSAALSLYICQSQSRASRVKRDKLDPKRRPFTFPIPPSGAPPLYPIQVLGGTLKCLLAYSIFTPPIEFLSPQVF